MAEPIQPLFDAMNEAATALAAAQKTFDERRAALLAVMPEGVEFSTVADHPPIIKRVGEEIHLVKKPFIGQPYEPETPPAAPTGPTP